MAEQTSDFYEFGRFRLKSDERVLLRGEEFVPLTPKAFDILLALLENDGRTVRKDDLMKKVWPDTFVEEGNLTQNVSLLRKALGESATGPQFIETVPRRGYRFVAPVSRGLSNGQDKAIEDPAPAQQIDRPAQRINQTGLNDLKAPLTANVQDANVIGETSHLEVGGRSFFNRVVPSIALPVAALLVIVFGIVT
jgi:DNA-binding winged helix-turn-helix (wHTH) protein